MSELPLSRTLCVLKILEQYSDETHPLTLQQIIALLREQYGLNAHRTTLTKDIEELSAYGVDIVKQQSTQNRYFIGSRVFEIPELRLLIDAIHSSKCLTPKKSEELIDKLTSLASVHQGKRLRERPLYTMVTKPKNEQIYYIIDTVNRAIELGNQIRFQYLEYQPDKTTVLRNDGEIYALSPYACMWNGDYYYVVGWTEKHRALTSFRVDRIASVPEITDVPILPPPKGVDPEEYSKTVFQMYSGPLATVQLQCRNDLMKTIIDRFGEDVEVIDHDETHFTVSVKVMLSPPFYGWLFEFGGKIRLVSPDIAIDIYKQMMESAFADL